MRFRLIYQILCANLDPPIEVIASGGALLKSPSWTQMMADALGRPVIACTEPEASARGAALWAMEQAGLIESVAKLPASTGAVFTPRPEHHAAYERMLSAESELYAKLFGTAQ